MRVRRRHRSGGGGGGGGALSSQRLFAAGLGGAALGFIEKAIPSLPTLPLIGRKGTIALACLLFGKGKHHSLLRDVGLAAAAIAGYELGSTGKVSGDDVDHNVRGVAAQV